jgi:hypothetical protein
MTGAIMRTEFFGDASQKTAICQAGGQRRMSIIKLILKQIFSEIGGRAKMVGIISNCRLWY